MFKGLKTAESGPDASERNLAITTRGLIGWITISTVVVFFHSMGMAAQAPEGRIWIVEVLLRFAAAMLVGGSSFAVGAFLGFLFGVPRTNRRDGEASSTEQAQEPRDRNGVAPDQLVNTNLEEISDWLTKILVGVGLTQLRQLPDELYRLGGAFPLGDSWSQGLALILSFLIAGFFGGYLLTRLFLASAFQVADAFRVADHRRKVTELAAAFEEAGAHEKAFSEYEGALASITPTTPKPEKRRIYEGLIFNALYDDPPQGFETAIRYATRYLEEEPATPSATILAYLAAAYGQQSRYLKGQGAESSALDAIKARALDAAKRALKVDPAVKPLLQMMWNPTHSAKSPGDDDLEVFYEDQEFGTLLG